MDNWPLFEERSAVRQIVDNPAYQDHLVAILIAMFALGSLLWSIYQRRGRKKTSGIHTILLIYLTLQPIALLGFQYAILVTDQYGGEVFWSLATKGILLALGYLLLKLLIFAVIWYAFGTRGEVKGWFGDFFKIWGISGIALYLPLMISLTSAETSLLGLLIGLIYFSFSILLIYQTLQRFPNLRKYPMHIILYLCTCKLTPMLFLLV